MDLIQIADERLAALADGKASLKEEVAKIDAEMKAIRAQRDLLAGAVGKAVESATSLRVTPTPPIFKAPALADKPKRGRKAGEKREKTIGEKILEYLANAPASSVEHIADGIREERRSISFTLQNLKKAGKVVRNGTLWSRTIASITPATETNDTIEEEDIDMMPSPIAADSDPGFGAAA